MVADDTELPCPECGAKTVAIRDGRTVGAQCTNCDWSVVTTCIPPIEQDATTYVIRVLSVAPFNREQVIRIARLTNSNFLQARKLLEEERPVVFSGKAPQIIAAREALISANLSIVVEPEFKWLASAK